jgi:hypothetical protein
MFVITVKVSDWFVAVLFGLVMLIQQLVTTVLSLVIMVR